MSCSILLGLALSSHIGLSGDYNSIHPNTRLECKKHISGIYYNSVEDVSLYTGFVYDITKDLSIEVGIASGYQYDTDIVPFGRLTYKHYYIAPAYENNTNKLGVVAGLQFYIGE